MNNYYWKHLRRTIRKQPLQPLLIILIFTLSFLILDVSFSTMFGIEEEERLRSANSYGSADVVVRTGTDSPSRFLFAEDAERVFPDAAATTSFTVPFLKNGSLIGGVAVPFSSVGELFDLSFSEYLPFSRGEARSVCFVSRAFADRNGLRAGSVLELEAFGKPLSLTVAGISEQPFLGTNPVLVDTSCAVELLIGDPAFAALLGESFTPGGTLYLRFAEGSDVSALIERTREVFTGCTVTATEQNVVSLADSGLRGINIVTVLLSVISAFAVVFCCTYCMARERAEVTVLFSLCGASRRRLLLARILEIAAYGSVGVLLGILLSVPAGAYAYRNIGFSFVRFRVDPKAVLLSGAVVLTVAALTPLLLREQTNAPRRKKKAADFPPGSALLIPIGTLALFCAFPLIPGDRKFPVAVAAIVLLALGTAVYVPFLYRRIPRRLIRAGKVSPSSVGIRNTLRVPALANTARLLVLLMTVIVLAGFSIGVSDRFAADVSGFLAADYVVSGGTARVREPLDALDEAEYVSGFLTADGELNGKYALSWALENKSALADKLNVDRLPHGDEVITSFPYAQKFGIREGDRVTLTINAVCREVTVSEVVTDSSMNCFLFDAEFYGISYPSYLVKTAPGVAENDLYRAVTSALSAEPVSVAPCSSIVEYIIDNDAMYIFFGRLILVLLSLFAVIGVADNLAESFRSRKAELELFHIAGMDRGAIRKMLRTELLYTALFTIAVGIPVTALALIAEREGLFSYGNDVFRLFLHI